MIKIYHNEFCSKSRAALELVQTKEEEVVVKSYLDETLTIAELKHLLEMLSMSPLDIIRKKEPLFVDKYSHALHTDEEWMQIMIEHPILIERPIIVKGDKAVIGRPIEKIIELF